MHFAAIVNPWKLDLSLSLFADLMMMILNKLKPQFLLQKMLVEQNSQNNICDRTAKLFKANQSSYSCIY